MSNLVVDTLMAEHRRIETMLFCLKKYVADLAGGKSVEPTDLKKFVDFVKYYSDRLHHLKEEDLLFKAMVDNGFPADEGPIGVMLMDHEEGRGYVRILASYATEPVAPWNAQDLEAMTHAALSFCGLLSSHIEKEDQVLYPMATQALPGATQMELTQQFEAFRAEHADELRKYEALSDELFARYGTGYQPQVSCGGGGFSCGSANRCH